MTVARDRSSRRDFVVDAGRLGVAGVLTACASAASPQGHPRTVTTGPAARGEWDLSWVDRIATSADRAVFDSPTIGEGLVLDLAGRYLDNCDAAYGPHGHDARVVLNVRTQAVGLGLTDLAWERHALGVEYTVKDPVTQQPAVRNPYWRRAPGASAPASSPTLEELVQRGAIVLVCDFALGHLAKRLATKESRGADEVHRELRKSFVPGAVAVPSGIFGLARAQNAGCAYVRM
jgi:hypothetical protein